MSKMIAKEAFFEEIFNLYPKGNPESAWNEAVYQVQVTKKTIFNEEITFDFIREKWQQYLAYCKKETRDERYVKGIESWLKAKDYQTNYNHHLNVKLPSTKKPFRS